MRHGRRLRMVKFPELESAFVKILETDFGQPDAARSIYDCEEIAVLIVSLSSGLAQPKILGQFLRDSRSACLAWRVGFTLRRTRVRVAVEAWRRPSRPMNG